MWLEQSRADVVVIGGGPAGASVAALLARAGRHVVVFERDAFPRDKLCGEFLSAEAQGWLEDIGCLDAVRAAEPTSIRVARFTSPSGRKLQVGLPGEALGISRSAFDQILLQHARHSGAQVYERTEVVGIERSGERQKVRVTRLPGGDTAAFEGVKREEVARLPNDTQTIEADLVIAAHGRRTRLDKTLGRAFMRDRHPYVGIKRHHRTVDGGALDAALTGAVEIHTFPGGYCGMSHVEGGRVNVCSLLSQRFVDDAGADWDRARRALAERSRALSARLDALEPVGDPLAVAEVPFAVKERARDGVLFIGDAAAMIAPLAGDGQAMALESALLASRLVLSRDGLNGIEARWTRTFGRTFRRRLFVAKRLQDALFAKGGSELTVGLVSAIPGLAGQLTRWTRG